MTEFLAFLVTLPTWILPLSGTVLLWVVLMNVRIPGATNAADLTPAIASAALLYGGFVVTLILWLIYFATEPLSVSTEGVACQD